MWVPPTSVGFRLPTPVALSHFVNLKALTLQVRHILLCVPSTALTCTAYTCHEHHEFGNPNPSAAGLPGVTPLHMPEPDTLSV